MMNGLSDFHEGAKRPGQFTISTQRGSKAPKSSSVVTTFVPPFIAVATAMQSASEIFGQLAQAAR